MLLDNISIVLRCAVLLVLAIVSQLALHRKQYSLALWTLSFWLTIFRLMAVRVLNVYAHQEDAIVSDIQISLMRGWPSSVTDIFLVLSSIPMFLWIKRTYQVWKRDLKI